MPTDWNRIIFLTIAIAIINTYTVAHAESSHVQTESGTLLKIIHSDRLRQLMLQLDSLVYEREYSELELDRIRRRQISQLVYATRELLDSSRELQDMVPATKLSSEDIDTFRALAAELHQTTLKLEQEVQSGHDREAGALYQRLRITCVACHSLFRGD